jgi:hypothetical protein
MNTELPTDLIGMKEAAKAAHCHIASIHRWRLAGKLRAWRRAGRYFVSRAELLALFEESGPRPKIKAVPRRSAAEAAHTLAVLKKHGLA